MGVNEKKAELFESLLSHKGLQALIDTAAHILDNPIFVVDTSMGLICKSTAFVAGESDYSASEDQELQLDLVAQAADAGYLDWLYKHDQPVIGTFEGQPRYLAARVRDGSIVLGHAVVSEVYRDFDSEDELILPVICQTIAFALRRTREVDPGAFDYGPLLIELLSGKRYDESRVLDMLRLFGKRPPASYRVLLFRQVDDSKIASLTYLRTQLFKVFPRSIGIIHAGECVHLVDGSMSLSEIGQKLVGSVYTGGLVIGTSRVFRRFTQLDKAYLQADTTLRLGSRTRLVPDYDDVFCQHIHELIGSGMQDADDVFILPELALIREFDERDGTDHLTDLMVYLNTGRNMSKSARILHVHKNSMYYRIGRIEELTKLDLSDEKTCFLLQLCLAMKGYGPSLAQLEDFPNGNESTS